MGEFNRKPKASKKNGKPPKHASATRTTKEPKAAKPKKPKKVDFEKLEREKVSEMLKARHEFVEAVAIAEEAKAHAGETRKAADAKQARCNSIMAEIDAIRSGEYQFELPFGGEMTVTFNGKSKPAATTTSVDQGASRPLEDLIEFGMTKAKCEKLAEAINGETVGDLEKFQREHEFWNRDLPGFGEEWITKLQDSQEQLRRRYPMPDPTLTTSEKAATVETKTAEETPTSEPGFPDFGPDEAWSIGSELPPNDETSPALAGEYSQS